MQLVTTMDSLRNGRAKTLAIILIVRASNVPNAATMAGRSGRKMARIGFRTTAPTAARK